MELRINLPFTKQSPDQIATKIAKLENKLKNYNLPRVIAESNGTKFYTYETGIYAVGQLDLTTPRGQADAYNTCAPLNSVVSRWLRAAGNAKWLIVDEKGKVIPNPKGALPGLMIRPNPLQVWNEFILHVEAMKMVHGQCYILKVRPDGMNDVTGMWVIPNYMITEKLTGKFLGQSDISGIVTGYQITYNGIITDVPYNDIIKIKDSSVNFYAGVVSTTAQGNSITDGQSRLFAMSDVINRLIAAYQAKKDTIIKRGPLGILSSDKGESVMNVPMLPKDEKALHDKLEAAYGTGDNQRQQIITKEALKWVQITKGIKDLMLFEEVEAGTREICAVMDYPFELLGYGTGASLAGGGKFLELKKMLYTDSVIPASEYLGQVFDKEFFVNGQYLKPYFDHLDVFQSSRQEDAAAMKTYNEACKIAYDSGSMELEAWKSGLENYM
jgi:hypothetical protein